MLVKRPRPLAIDSRAVRVEVADARAGSSRPRRRPGRDRARSTATSCRTRVPRRPRRGDVKPGFKKLTLLHPERPARCAGRRARRPRGARRRAPARRRGARRPRGPARSDARLARLGAARRPAIARALAAGAGRGHGARLLPLRPLSTRATTTTRRRRARAAGDRRRRRPSRADEAEARVALRRRRGREPRPRAPGPALERAHPRAARRARAGDRRRAPTVEVEVLDRAAIAATGMGGLVAVSQGAPTEPRLIALRYARRRRRRALGLVGKARHLRQRRDLDQALRRHGGDEDGHVGRRPRCSRRSTRSPSWGSNSTWSRSIPATENMPSGHRGQARRHHHPAERQDGRGQQHRRRGPADPRRRAHLLRSRAGGRRGWSTSRR